MKHISRQAISLKHKHTHTHLDHIVEDKMGQDHDGVRAHAGAIVLEAVVDAMVPRLKSVGEPERKVSERHDDVCPHLCCMRAYVLCVYQVR